MAQVVLPRVTRFKAGEAVVGNEKVCSDGLHSGAFEISLKSKGEIHHFRVRKGLRGRPSDAGLAGRPELLRKELRDFAEFKVGKMRMHGKDDQLSNAERDGLSVGTFGFTDCFFGCLE